MSSENKEIKQASNQLPEELPDSELPDEALEDIAGGQADINPPAEVGSPSLLKLDPTSAKQPGS